MYPDRKIRISIVLSLFSGLILLAALAFEITTRQAAAPESSLTATPDVDDYPTGSKEDSKDQCASALATSSSSASSHIAGSAGDGLL